MKEIKYFVVIDTREKENLHILKAFEKHNIVYKKRKVKFWRLCH